MTNTEDYETYVDDVSDHKRPKSQEDTTNCSTTSNMTYLLKKTDLLMTWLKNILDTLTTQRR